MNFPFKGIGFDWAYTLVDLGKEDDRSPLKKVFGYLSSKNLSLPDFEEFLDQSRKIFHPMIENSRTTNQEAHFDYLVCCCDGNRAFSSSKFRAYIHANLKSAEQNLQPG